MSALEFGVNLSTVGSAQDFAQSVRRVEDLGFDVFAAPDHLGAVAPFTALATAGTVSARLRLRTYVLNVGFWNPALLAREVASLDLLTRGRAELGLGAGHMRSEHDDAGLPWPPLRRRVGAGEDMVVEVRRRLTDDTHHPRPVQRPVPVMVGTMSAAGLTVAARHAEIVGFSGARQVTGAAPGTLTLFSAAETAERVEQVRRQSDGRPYRSDVLLQAVVIGRPPEVAAAEIAATVPTVTTEQLLDTPFVLLARDADHAAAELRRRQEVYGFDSVTTHQPYLEALGEVIAAHRAGDLR